MIRISRLDDARHCGLSAALDTKSTTTAGLMGNAFHAANAAFHRPTDERLQAARAVAMGRLDAEDRFDTEVLLKPLLADWVPPAGAAFEVPVGVDRHGCYVEVERAEDGTTYRATAADAPALLTAGTADCAWVEPWRDGKKIVKVPDFKSGARARYNVPRPPGNLQVAAYGFALADKHNAAAMALGVYLAHDHEWHWAEVALDSDEASGLWEEVRAAALRDPAEAVLGGHCADCWVRLRCPAYVLPAVDGAAADYALAPMQKGGEALVTPERLVRMIHAATAMKDIAEEARDWLKAYVRDHGPITDGEKVWGPVDVKGRESTSVKSLVEAGLYETAQNLGAVKLSPPSVQHRWTNAYKKGKR